ncbi:hypothetical protein HSBAA_38890 [Vreelandella sulfidaeris]|uniref:Uncharacterized protein n=1 Tax=Vreelandella sulfidaeris TaxID=115553 RepID=A0A455UBD0_9GAMM|nr:hypothetical protein HSBAA_38890 [Halomonas sulfidaeris]
MRYLLAAGYPKRFWKIYGSACPKGARRHNAVTLESEALLAHWQHKAGGELMRLELANAAPSALGGVGRPAIRLFSGGAFDDSTGIEDSWIWFSQ